MLYTLTDVTAALSVGRSKGGLLLAAYLAYTAYLINTVWVG